MTVKTNQSLPPEIDTTLDGDKGGPRSSSSTAFLEADTPKQGNNRKSPGRPQYHPQGYPPYHQSGQSSSHMPNNYYGHHGHPQSAMVSPGGSTYNQNYNGGGGHPPPTHGHGAHGHGHGHGHGHYGYPPANAGPHPHGGGYGPPPPSYGNQAAQYGNGRFPPPYGGGGGGEMNGGRQHQQQQQQQPQQQQHYSQTRQHYQNPNNMDFSRAVSSSFGESKQHQHQHQHRSKRSSGSLHSGDRDRDRDRDRDPFESRDDNSMAESDSSWKQLNQVASIEEDKLHQNDGRFGATTPVDRLCPTLSSDMSRSPSVEHVSKKEKSKSAMTLSSIPSMQEPLEAGGDLDLRLCSTGSSGLLFYDEGSSKRSREERNDTSTRRNTRSGGRDADERREPSPPNLGHLSMREERDAPPSKKRNIGGGGRDSYNDFGSIDPLGISTITGNSTKQSSRNSNSMSNSNLDNIAPAALDEMPDSGIAGLDAKLSWDITGQDSFGGGFSVTSNLDGNKEDVLGSSFSFSNDNDFASPGASNQTNNNVMKTFKESDSLGLSLNPSESMDLNENGRGSRGSNYPPSGPTWVSNVHSAGSFGMESVDRHGRPAPHYPPPSRTNSQGSHPAMSYGPPPMPPPYGEGRPHYPPRHASYPGMPRPQGFLPPSFRPPPPGMSGPSMPRNAPPSVYMMSSPPGTSSMNGGKSQVSAMTKSGAYNWSKADDTRLTEILKKFKNPKNWESIAKEVGDGRTAKQCNERWIRYLKPGVRKGQWQDHEDAIVIDAVATCKEQPFTRWSDLAQKLPGRVGKQIRDRWVNHLNPNINHMPFTKEDDMKLWDGHKQLGKRWVEISTKFFKSSRSENHIKNRWYSASFKKFVATEFGPEAYIPCDKKAGRKPKAKGKK